MKSVGVAWPPGRPSGVARPIPFSFERRATIFYRVTGGTVEIVRVLHKDRLAEGAFIAD
jgi:plasmid stabilization system protein ParE